jgi:DNA helicase-2/ATP-dependent DNA helicase PcrA
MKIYTLKREHEERKLKIDYKKELNEQQLDVVFSNSNSWLVLAGPGSGKTRVLVYRVAYLLEKGIKPDSIMLLTFTNKAARNMLNRVEQLLGFNPKGTVGGTFHHVGNLFLRKHAELIGFNNNFSIIDNQDSIQLIKDIIANMPEKEKHFPKAKVVFSIISFARNSCISVKECIKERFEYFNRFIDKIEKIAEIYERRKLKGNMMDFDDLLYYWKVLLDKKEIREYYVSKFEHILVDEFQDTNRLQFEIIKRLADSNKNNIMVVGDDCQSIYSFRGAEIRNILEFPKYYKNTKEYRLEINYRSTPEILDLINNSIKNNRYQFKKTLKSINKNGNKPILIRCRDTEQEAEFICQRILELREEGINYRDIGILFRADYQAMEIELELTRRGIPFNKRSGLGFFEQAHIKDVTAFLKIFSNNKDELAWKRVLCLFEGIGEKTASRIWELVKEKGVDNLDIVLGNKAMRGWNQFKEILRSARNIKMPSELANMFLESFYREYMRENFVNFRDRELDVRQYINLADQYSSIGRFLESILANTDFISRKSVLLFGGEELKEEDEEDAVVLSTIHQAKGLEWKVVFLVGLADERFPLSIAYLEGNIEEERRLFYVGCSRAKKELYLTLPMEAYAFGRGNKILKDSLFLRELNEDLYEEWNIKED